MNYFIKVILYVENTTSYSLSIETIRPLSNSEVYIMILDNFPKFVNLSPNGPDLEYKNGLYAITIQRN